VIGVGVVYALVGTLFAAIAAACLLDRGNPRRWGCTVFWGLFAASFLFGDRFGDRGNGMLVLGLVLIGGLGSLFRPSPSATGGAAEQARFGPALFLPILVVPAVTLIGSLVFKSLIWAGRPLVDPKQVAVISLALGVVLALGVAMAMTRSPLLAPIREARRLMGAVGWAAILPQLLAALGAVFALAGVGRAVGELAGHGLPLDMRWVAVATYGLGMTLFTMVMGNAFAALPVMIGAIGAPLLIGRFGGNPAVIGSLGMLCGYCGTLMTPMAAHNIVPTVLLDLPPGAVIRAQAPTALLVLAANLLLINIFAFRH
jgi:uncharacterized membrane protein